MNIHNIGLVQVLILLYNISVSLRGAQLPKENSSQVSEINLLIAQRHE